MKQKRSNRPVKSIAQLTEPHEDEVEHDFEYAQSGASKTFPMQCSALRKNGNVLIKDQPCKIVEMATSKTGKHGHAKVHLVGISLVNGKKYEDICPSTHNMDVPNVSRKDYLLMNISHDGFLSLMDDDNGETFHHIKIPENDVGKDIAKRHKADENILVTVLSTMDYEIPVAVKMDTKK